MSGHSKWSQIKHKKAATDARKGKMFSRLSKEISVAARIGGGNADMNSRLRLVIEKAKEVNMPSDNIKRAIQKGTGELPGSHYEEIMYEGYGHGGVAIMIDVMTDNKTRTVAEIRHILSKHGGNMGETGCVSWMFDKKGYILVNKNAIDEDTLMSKALDAGAEDFKNDPEEENYEIVTAPEDMNRVKEFLASKNIPLSLSEVTYIPRSYIALNSHDAEKILKLIEALEDHDDVQNVYANFDVPDEIIAKAE
ncbi:MAG: YebC/PmpR family DNA-binding transcriptional regulator [Nitrospiraceae bacterium]|nr:MAG: YebC/PmpR family DNA-binding transcriptional regulator [Nitrospiraceae bacterium]